MDESKKDQDIVKDYLKALLLQLAAKSENPGSDLQNLMREVISELHEEVKKSLARKNHLRVVPVQNSASEK